MKKRMAVMAVYLALAAVCVMFAAKENTTDGQSFQDTVNMLEYQLDYPRLYCRQYSPHIEEVTRAVQSGESLEEPDLTSTKTTSETDPEDSPVKAIKSTGFPMKRASAGFTGKPGRTGLICSAICPVKTALDRLTASALSVFTRFFIPAEKIIPPSFIPIIRNKTADAVTQAKNTAAGKYTSESTDINSIK